MKKNLCIGVLIMAGQMSPAQSKLMFTEICVANIDQTLDHSNNYGGWVELYNGTGTDVSLGGWYISDNEANLKKHRLTGEEQVKAGSYCCLFFGHNAADGGAYGSDAARQVAFKLNRKGGKLYLSHNGTDKDLSLDYPPSVPRCSFARVSLDADVWQYSGLPTPGEANAGPFADDILPAPTVSCDSRLFTEDFSGEK